MATTPAFELRARATGEPEPDLTSTVVIHRAMREDLRRLADCLGVPSGSGRSGPPSQRAVAIGRYTAALLAEIRAHHEGQDGILWPVVAATAGQSVDLTPLTDDHQAIETAICRVGLALDSLSGEPAEPCALARLRAAVGALRDMLDQHIAEEDEQILPAMRRYLSADAYRWYERQTRRDRRRFTVPWLAGYARPEELRRLLAAGGWQARLRLAAARPGYARLERRAFESRPESHPGSGGPDDDCEEKMTLNTEERANRTGTVPAAHSVGLGKTYGTGQVAVRALADVTVTFERGRFTAVMGPSGSGKSTLMHCMAGLDRPTSGHAYVGGRDISTLDDVGLTTLRRDRIGFVFQSFNLIPTLTAAENIALPVTLAGARVDRDWLYHLASQLGITDRLTHRPGELSGGQQQRVACARALITKPDLVFADEPTGNLDSNASAEVLAFLRRSVTELGQSVVMVTHDPHGAAYADTVIFLTDGAVAGSLEHPTAASVLARMRTLGE